MKFNGDIPSAVVDGLKRAGVEPDGVELSLASDIDLVGRYDPQWVLATRGGGWVFSESAPRQPTVSVSMDEVAAFRTTAAVGSGLLQAKVDGFWVDLARYSNRRKYWFARLARRLSQLREGETIELETEDYIIGSISLPNYPPYWDVHAYVHRDGWIVVYYLNTDLSAKLLNVKAWTIDTTSLATIISSVPSSSGAS